MVVSRVVFTNANLLDGENAAAPHSTVVVEGDRITYTGDGTGIETRPDDRLVDCAGRTLMPGMTTGHYHPTYSLVDTTPIPGFEDAPAYLAYKAAFNSGKTLRAGFTSAVGASSPYAVDPSLAKAIRDGLVEGPRVVPCSAEIVTTADATDHVPWHWRAPVTPGVVMADGPDEWRKAVRREIKQGAQIIKTYVTGGHGVRFGSEFSSVTLEELRAAVDAAHALGVRVRSHVASKVGIMKCLDAGVDVIDHGDWLDMECIERMAEAGCVLVPSIYMFFAGSTMRGDTELEGQYGKVVRSTAAILPSVVEAGIPIALGDDYGATTAKHGQQGRELPFYQQITGLSALEIIKWATVHGGAIVGRPDEVGRIAPGYLADILLVDGDPSQDLGLMAEPDNLVIVMRDGQFFVDRSRELAPPAREPVSAGAVG